MKQRAGRVVKQAGHEGPGDRQQAEGLVWGEVGKSPAFGVYTHWGRGASLPRPSLVPSLRNFLRDAGHEVPLSNHSRVHLQDTAKAVWLLHRHTLMGLCLLTRRVRSHEQMLNSRQ